jgi:hypothetical protein
VTPHHILSERLTFISATLIYAVKEDKNMLENDPDYEKIKGELEPFVTKITKKTGKRTDEYLRFKKNYIEWDERFTKAMEMAGIIHTVARVEHQLRQDLEIKPGNRRPLSVLLLYRYLGSGKSSRSVRRLNYTRIVLPCF